MGRFKKVEIWFHFHTYEFKILDRVETETWKGFSKVSQVSTLQWASRCCFTSLLVPIVGSILQLQHALNHQAVLSLACRKKAWGSRPRVTWLSGGGVEARQPPPPSTLALGSWQPGRLLVSVAPPLPLPPRATLMSSVIATVSAVNCWGKLPEARTPSEERREGEERARERGRGRKREISSHYYRVHKEQERSYLIDMSSELLSSLIDDICSLFVRLALAFHWINKALTKKIQHINLCLFIHLFINISSFKKWQHKKLPVLLVHYLSHKKDIVPYSCVLVFVKSKV